LEKKKLKKAEDEALIEATAEVEQQEQKEVDDKAKLVR